MAKLVVIHDKDPGISVIFTEVPPGRPETAQGWYGRCTECGRAMHWWHMNTAFEAGRMHVDSHDSSL